MDARRGGSRGNEEEKGVRDRTENSSLSARLHQGINKQQTVHGQTLFNSENFDKVGWLLRKSLSEL